MNSESEVEITKLKTDCLAACMASAKQKKAFNRQAGPIQFNIYVRGIKLKTSH